MKKTLLTLAVASVSLFATDVVAQDKAAATKIEQSAENKQKEADALKERIEEYSTKIEANKNNPKLDYEAEIAKLAEWKKKWEDLTGKKWADKKKH